jgi:hypothetical protein
MMESGVEVKGDEKAGETETRHHGGQKTIHS